MIIAFIMSRYNYILKSFVNNPYGACIRQRNSITVPGITLTPTTLMQQLATAIYIINLFHDVR